MEFVSKYLAFIIHTVYRQDDLQQHQSSSDSGGSTGLRRCLFWAFCRTHVLHRTGHGAKTCASRVYSRLRWSEEEDERVLTVASAVALGRSGGAHIVGRGVVARRRQAVKGPMECERGHECSGECYRAGGLGTDGSIKRRMGIERTRGWMRGRSPWCRFRHAEWKWNCGSGGIPDSLTLTHGPRARVICACTHELG